MPVSLHLQVRYLCLRQLAKCSLLNIWLPSQMKEAEDNPELQSNRLSYN